MAFVPSLSAFTAPGDFLLAKRICAVEPERLGQLNVEWWVVHEQLPPVDAEQHQMILMSNMVELCQSCVFMMFLVLHLSSMPTQLTACMTVQG